jgi:phosphatidylglycerophosphate synthase
MQKPVKKKSFFADYSTSLKDPCAEEIIDLFLYRPLAYLFVKIFLPLPVTPNQVSFLAMAGGVAAGFCLAGGSPGCFMLGGILYGLSNIFDCCDGMLARIKKNGTATGRIVDGVIDYINGAAVFTGLGIGLSSAVHAGTLHLPCNAWVLVFIAAASTALHAICSDYYRNAYIGRLHTPCGGCIENEMEKFNSELSRLNALKGHGVDKTLLRLYLGYLKLQAAKPQRRGAPATPPVPAAITPAKVILWNCIGPSTHISFFLIAAILFRPGIFFLFCVVLANIWMGALFVAQFFENIRQRPAGKF